MTDLLLDTHVLFWFDTADPRIPTGTLHALRDSSARLFVSVASIFEIGVAIAKGRWPAASFYFPNAERKLLDAGYAVLPIEARHVEAAIALPRLHNDPWDRLLIGTAVSDGLTLVTADSAIHAYGIGHLWS